MRCHNTPVLAVLGASDFQAPLIRRAQEMGCEVHAFAWRCGDSGEAMADAFHPVSTAERDEVLRICREVGADGVATIGSDFNNAVATWVANRLGLPANSDECALLTTDKREMRRALAAGGDPCPKSVAVGRGDDVGSLVAGVPLPAIVKPSDRSGSRGITRVDSWDALPRALEAAWAESLSGTAMVEGFLGGEEFSVESFSWEGTHRVLQVTRKYTTGAPRFVEKAHLEPPLLDEATCSRIGSVVTHALGTLGVRQGASHAEVKVAPDGSVGIVEVASRMGGDLIGSDLVPLSTGVDYVGAVVEAALGREPDLSPRNVPRAAAVRFVLSDEDYLALEKLRERRPDLIARSSYRRPTDQEVTDSAARFGWFVMAADDPEELLPWLPGPR